MSEKAKKDISKWKVVIIGIGFVIGVVMLIFGGRGGDSKAEPQDNGIESYRAALESELESLCEAMTGGDVEVFVTLDGGFSYSYALDSRGGVVTVGSGSSESALVESVLMPAISGVGIVYSGVESSERERALLELVSSSLGVGANKIFIIGTKKSAGQS